MTPTNPDAANHLADLDARYDAHVEALRRHAERLQEELAAAVAELNDRLDHPTSRKNA